MPTIKIPITLRELTRGEREVSVDAETIAEMIDKLEALYPGLGGRLVEEDGSLRAYINLYVGGNDVRLLGGKAAKLRPDSEVFILPAVSGGGG